MATCLFILCVCGCLGGLHYQRGCAIIIGAVGASTQHFGGQQVILNQILSVTSGVVFASGGESEQFLADPQPIITNKKHDKRSFVFFGPKIYF